MCLRGQKVANNLRQGNVYTSTTGPVDGTSSSDATALFPARPAALLAEGGSDYYERTKPRYEDVPASSFLSARTYGARADGTTDDTAALNKLFADAAAGFATGAIAFVDAGYYTVLDTVYIPPNTRIVGEALSSVILGTGPKFADMAAPRPVVQVGREGETAGRVEWSDMLVSTKGGTAGATLIEFNLLSADEPSGMWDVHLRVGGFAGSDLLVGQCLKTPDVAITEPDPACTAAYMGMHVTKPAGNLYIENNWLWVAEYVQPPSAFPAFFLVLSWPSPALLGSALMLTSPDMTATILRTSTAPRSTSSPAVACSLSRKSAKCGS